MLCQVGWIRWSKSRTDGTVNSLILRRPKNAREKAAANMLLSCLVKDRATLILANIFFKIGSVIGCLVVRATVAWARLAPWNTRILVGRCFVP